MPNRASICVAVAFLLLTFGCGSGRAPSSQATPAPTHVQPVRPAATATPPASPSEPAARIANPASKKCAESGGAIQVVNAPGGQAGVCVFQDGSRCEEWRLLRGECLPGSCRAESGICK